MACVAAAVRMSAETPRSDGRPTSVTRDPEMPATKRQFENLVGYAIRRSRAVESYSRAEAEEYIKDVSSAWAECVATNGASVVQRPDGVKSEYLASVP